MKLLAVEASATSASCCVTENGRVLSQAAVHTKLTHSQTLMPMIESVLRCAALHMNDIDRLAVAVGPGSFTGIRIGVAAVKGLAFPRKLPCAAVSTLEAMAAMTDGLPFDGLICPVMDARCRQVYTALFDHSGGICSRLTPDSALPIDELKTLLLSHGKPVYLLG
ncbi:MAG: tRNA (adenosine(37)-N6)-threonylcarbamoyltransferase complex dimerization subunit type 1 TsaB, partial [Clostridia bacterium]|nr:tRNA (adenosine(37)-N6)-threonylcarbamoyltransferase complex dimerization subunit type 1 TsaB [Clostridia bacterium]